MSTLKCSEEQSFDTNTPAASVKLTRSKIPTDAVGPDVLLRLVIGVIGVIASFPLPEGFARHVFVLPSPLQVNKKGRPRELYQPACTPLKSFKRSYRYRRYPKTEF